MQPYSSDLRLRAVMAYERGEGSLADIARRYEISKDTLCDWCRRHRKNASIVPLPHGGGQQPILTEDDRQFVLDLVAERNEITLAELRDELFVKRDVRIGTSTISNLLLKEDLTRKKRRCGQLSAKHRNGKPNGKPTSKK